MTESLGALEHDYEVLEKIHESGLETIYKVRHRLLDEIRAVRIVLPDPDTDPRLLGRLQDEARSTVLLRHRNTVELYDFSIAPEGQALIVMEYIDGVNLSGLRGDRDSLSISRILEISLQTLDALEFLHSAGFVHRNLSPEGIMLTQDMEGRPLVKIIDLGLVRSLQDGQHLTTLEMFLGKTHYASPEQFNESEIVAQSDLYSFGVVLYELLTGELPIQGQDLFSVIDGHLHHPPRGFDETDPQGLIPKALRDIVLGTLSKDPADRPRSAKQLARHLRSFRERHGRGKPESAGPSANADTVALKLGSGMPQEVAGSDPNETVVLPLVTDPDVPITTFSAGNLRSTEKTDPTETHFEGSIAEPDEPDAEPSTAMMADSLLEEPETAHDASEPVIEPRVEATVPAHSTWHEEPKETSPRRLVDSQPAPTPVTEDRVRSPESPENSGSRPLWPWVIAAAALVALIFGASYRHFSQQRSVPARVSELIRPEAEGGATPPGFGRESETPRSGTVPPKESREQRPPGVGSQSVEVEPRPVPPEIEREPGSPDLESRPLEPDPELEDWLVEPDETPKDDPEVGSVAAVRDPGSPRSSTVRDPRTGLIWLSSDNEQDIDWVKARNFCERNTNGSYTDWRLPTLSELRSIYDRESQNQMKTRLGIRISDLCVWSSQGNSDQAEYFTFMTGESGRLDKIISDRQRAICVSGG